MTKKMHIPHEGYGAGLQGWAYCSRWAHYMTADWASIKRAAAADDGAVFCLQRLKEAFPKTKGGN